MNSVTYVLLPDYYTCLRRLFMCLCVCMCTKTHKKSMIHMCSTRAFEVQGNKKSKTIKNRNENAIPSVEVSPTTTLLCGPESYPTVTFHKA
jgi:hypothetical protein